VSATVLVIEDEPDIRDLVRINLEMDGHRVILAADGAEGLAAIHRERPDVVLLDVMLPEMDGWEVLTRLKAADDELLSSVPVLMLTARTDPMDRLRGGIEGAIRYLTKPFSPSKLREEVRDALGGAPEPVRRRQAQQDALAELARRERGGSGEVDTDVARPHLTRLEPARVAPSRPQPAPAFPPGQLNSLSAKQRQLLEAVASSTTVSQAADRLDVSRSNVYASLRRIARKLGVRTVTELVNLARAGGLG
jgi:DNA-binding response OmpR family regulator